MRVILQLLGPQGGMARNALWVVAALLFASGLVRIGGIAGPAIAKEVVAADSSDLQAEEPEFCATDEATAAILADLLQREKALVEREHEMDERAQSIAVAREEIRVNMDALVQAEEKLSATIASAESASETDIARLTTVYENMKPKDASALFEQMNPEFAAGFIARMRPDAAANVLTGLQPETAYTISVILAGRNALTPTD